MTVLSALCAAFAVALLIPPSRARRTSPRQTSRPGLADPRVARVASLVVGVVFAVAWGGVVGLMGGALIAVALPIGLARLEPRAARRRREALMRQAAPAVDLLAACLASGAPISSSVGAVAAALGEPIARPLRTLVDAIELGADPAVAWHDLAADAPLAPLARAAARSTETGAPLSEVLRGTAADLRRDQRSRAEAQARASGVKAVGPLAACFLPAFLLIGVVPVVVSLAIPLVTGGFAP